jgi:parallel beta-helix repeat protein
VVNWGDNTQTLGSVQRTNGAGSPYEVLGSHTYAKPGIYQENASVLDLGSSVTTTLGGVTFTNSDNGGFGLQLPGTITLNVATYQTTAFPISGLANQAISAALGAFTYSNPANPTPTFTASINWGDNSPPSAGTVTVQPDGSYLVDGSHTYAQGNTAGQPSYPVTVTITDNLNHSTQFVTPATIAQNLTVTTTADSGPGSLRNVIEALNSSGQAGPITFNIPGSGVHTINLLSPLPVIDEPVVIDGSSEPGFSGSPLIDLSGAAIQPSVYGAVYGLQLAGGTSLVRDLVLNGFGSAGILLKGPGSDVVVSNYIGTNPQGTAAVPNGEGILVQGSSGNVIASNLISGNSYAGIELFNNATIKGTGYDPTAVAVHNAIESNVIGTNLASTQAVPNGIGVLINDAGYNLLGGLTPAAGNVISGNTSYGVQILGEHATGNVLLANIIGTDRSHTRRLGNSIGVYLYAQIGNVVDQSSTATGNVIVFNGTNVLTRSLSQGPQVQRAILIPGASSTIAGFSIIYSTYVDPTRASTPSNFILQKVLGKGKFGPAIPLTATYYEQYRLTQLILTSPVPNAGTYQLTIVGTAPGGVTDRVGIFLAGNPSAVRTAAGSNYVATYTNGVQTS